MPCKKRANRFSGYIMCTVPIAIKARICKMIAGAPDNKPCLIKREPGTITNGRGMEKYCKLTERVCINPT